MPSSRNALAAAGLILAAASPASAQTIQPSLDVRTWRPSTDPAASLVLEPIATPGPWAWNTAAWIHYTNEPVAITPSGGTSALHPIASLLGADLTANLGLGARAAVGLDLPAFLYQEGSTGLPPSASTATHVPSTGLGDIAVTGKAAIVTNEAGGFGLAALGALTLPTGDRESFMGLGTTTVGARLVADYSFVLLEAQASLGYTFVTADRTWLGVEFGDQIPWSIGLVFHPVVVHAIDRQDRQTWEVALHGWLPAGPVGPFGTGDPGSQALSPVLLSLSDRVALGHYRDTFLLIGGEIGLTDAIGVPTFRLVASVGWAPRSHDRDHDGVPDDVDQCPDTPEDIDGFEDFDGCPEVDTDDDGVPDEEDACPRVKGERDPDPGKNGCPHDAPVAVRSADRDSDDIPDPADRCPDQPEDRDGFQDDDGCPDPDNDGDGIADAVDYCPMTPGEPSPDPRLNGCPNPDHDGDTFDDAVDKCPREPETWNGVADDDGCPDEGGHALVAVDLVDPRLGVRLHAPLRFRAGPGAALDPSSEPTVRALAAVLNQHRDWTLAVGVRPDAGFGAAEAGERAARIAGELVRWTHRESAAEPVAWSVVARQPGSESGVGLLVLVGATRPVAPLRLRPEAPPAGPGTP